MTTRFRIQLVEFSRFVALAGPPAVNKLAYRRRNLRGSLAVRGPCCIVAAVLVTWAGTIRGP